MKAMSVVNERSRMRRPKGGISGNCVPMFDGDLADEDG